MNNEKSSFLSKKHFTSNKDLIFALVIYLIIGIFILKYYQHLINPDVICYINIAEKYATGDIGNAVNGYWGPLFSWALIPFLLKDHTPLFALTAAKIVLLMTGVFTIAGLWFLSKKFPMDRTIRLFFLFSIIPIILSFIYGKITPDLLMVTALIFYLNSLFDSEYPQKYKNGVISDLTGALAYLSKAFALPFFLAHFILFNCLYYFKKYKPNKKRVRNNLIIGLTVFLIISGVWAVTISEKYDELTFGTSSKYNFALVGPEIQEHHPQSGFGLYKPPNDSATSSWEDPSYIKMPRWSPFESWANFNHQLKVTWNNMVRTATMLYNFSIITFIIIICAFIFLLKSADSEKKFKMASLLITIFLTLIGFWIIRIEPRYIMLIYFLIPLMAGYLLNIIKEEFKIDHKIKTIMAATVFILLVISPITSLYNTANPENTVYELSENIIENYQVQGNIATNTDRRLSMAYAYYLDAQYYGTIPPNDNLEANLLKNNIDFYLVWNTRENIDLDHYYEMENPSSNYPRVFKRLK